MNERVWFRLDDDTIIRVDAITAIRYQTGFDGEYLRIFTVGDEPFVISGRDMSDAWYRVCEVIGADPSVPALPEEET